MEDFRCWEHGCNKLLGKVDKDGVFHFESTRIPVSFKIEKRIITCKNSKEHVGAKNKVWKFKAKPKDKQIKTE